jgi:putative endopeptidase
MSVSFKSISILVLMFLVVSCTNNSKDQSKQHSQTSDPLTAHIDSSIQPGSDFFSFANGKWFKENPIPASESSNGIFLIIQDSVNAAVKQICELSAKNTSAQKGSNQQKIGDFFYSGMDTSSINKAGISNLSVYLKAIDDVSNQNMVLAQAAALHRIGVPVLFDFMVHQDEKISSKIGINITQGGIGLPERDYYTNTDSRTLEIREAYKEHIEKIFVLAGSTEQEAKQNALAVLKIETELAKGSRKMEALRDPFKNYNNMSLAALTKMTPSIDWQILLENLGIKNADSVNVGQPEFFRCLETVLQKQSISDLKIYFKWNLLSNYASFLDSKFEYEDFLFYTQKLSGNKEQKPRWQIIVETTDKVLGDLIGEEYVANYLPPNSKEKLLEIGNNIMEVYRTRISKCDWMSETTKSKALKKLSTVSMKIGYPDKWKDYSALEITRESYLQNIINAKIWIYNEMINKYGKPVDRTEWHMTPQMYNAYYNPSNNEIVIPACNILVPGYAKNEMPEDAILYGIIGGSTFGHEITHGFDDEGSLYDEFGNLNNWWTKEDRENFKKRTQILVKQYDGYVMLDTMHLRGLNTLGENLADLGGVAMGYEAFKRTKEGQANEIKHGYTAEQRFFLAYAFAWLNQRRDEEIAKRIMTDVHSPSKYRVNGPISNMPEYYKAFGVEEGNAMYRADSIRVKIW